MKSTNVPLIPRRNLHGNPDHAMVKISPDGAWLAWLAPRDGVLNVWVAPRQDISAARPVTQDTGQGIRYYDWAYTSEHVLYIQDKNGDENWRLFVVDLQEACTRDLTPFENTQAQVIASDHKNPERIIVALNNRDPQWHDIYQLDIISGELTLLLQHDRFAWITVDNDYRLHSAAQMTPDGGFEVYIPDGKSWQLWDTVPPADVMAYDLVGFDKENRIMTMKDSRGRDTSAVLAVDAVTKASRLLAEDPRADAEEVLLHPTEKNVQAVSFIYERKNWQILDPAIAPDMAYLRTVMDGDLEITSRSNDDLFWVVFFKMDDLPFRYYLYDRAARQAHFLFTNRTALEGQLLVKMHSTVIKSRDGLNLVAYHSLPPGSDSNQDGIPDQPVPMVLIPHGGPWGRDYWGFDPWHQWLANRGYAVLAVNFRSSTGFGKAFTNAGDLEWGGKIMDDQVDAVRWAIAQGIADPQRVAVFGGSFGGYSTLAGLTFNPELFSCGVDLVGPSNLITLLESIPPYWKPELELFTTRVGDYRTEEGRALLTRHSPLTHVDRICRPLLIGQGANDPRVKQAESDQIVQVMQAKNIPVTYVLYPDEGHGFARPENRLSFYAITEAFLGACLGGRVEPIGDDFNGSSMEIRVGKEYVPGLDQALG
jgi:dipeptidyl aminopeptidase/acylaminoacyl peptidase